ncbi:MAG: ABC transporter substrate-binding protein [Thermodesulfobacteriota bacterium]
MSFRSGLLWKVALVLVLLTIPFSLSAAAGRSVKIGVAGPMTGSAAFDGKMIARGAALALEQFKSAGKLARYNVQMVVEDDKSDPKEAAAIANKFVGDNDLMAVVGNYNSSCTLAAAPILTKAGITQISPGSSSPRITGFSDYLFRTQLTDAANGMAVAEWAAESGFKKAAIIYENSDYGKGLQEVYAAAFPKQGRQIVATETYLSGQTSDFTATLTKVKAAGADVLLLGSLYNEGALIGKQAKQLGLRLTAFGAGLNTEAFTQLGKDAVEGWHVVGAIDFDSSDPKIQAFVQAFKKKYGDELDPYAAQSYDAAMLLLAALDKVGPDRAKIQQFVFKVKAFPGITGQIEFVKGDVLTKPTRYLVKNGKLISVQK